MEVFSPRHINSRGEYLPSKVSHRSYHSFFSVGFKQKTEEKALKCLIIKLETHGGTIWHHRSLRVPHYGYV